MLYKEFEKNREDILENEFCMQSDASTLPITDCPSYTPICNVLLESVYKEMLK